MLQKPTSNQSKQETVKSAIGQLAAVLPSAKSSSQDGILPEPPWEAIKKVAEFFAGRVAKDARVDYQLTHDWGREPDINNLSVYVSATPFRWRIDLISSYENNYQAIFIYDGNQYYSCYSSDDEGKDCGKVDSLEQLGIPPSLTDFLNEILDTLLLKQFISQVPQVSVRTIANKTADCLKIKFKNGDQESESEICTDQESKIPLFIWSKSFSQFTLEATKLEVSPISADVFTPSIQPSPTPSDETANWKAYTSQEGKYSLKYPENVKIYVNEKFSVDGIKIPLKNTLVLLSDVLPGLNTNYQMSISHIAVSRAIAFSTFDKTLLSQARLV